MKRQEKEAQAPQPTCATATLNLFRPFVKMLIAGYRINTLEPRSNVSAVEMKAAYRRLMTD